MVDNQYRSMAGPFDRAAPPVAIIDHHYREHGKTYCYSNAGHYQLAKHGLLPRTKCQLSK